MSDTSRVVEIMQAIVGELKSMARSETVVGAQVAIGDRIVVPVTKITLGFGAGGGEGTCDQKMQGFGGGGGGGVSIEPVGFLVMDRDRVHLLTIRKQGVVDSILEAAPDLIQSIKDWSGKKASAGAEMKKEGA